jgi:hypothetical protein
MASMISRALPGDENDWMKDAIERKPLATEHQMIFYHRLGLSDLALPRKFVSVK